MTALKTLVASALNVRPGEGGLTAMLLAHAFFVGMTTVSFSTAANALFLATFDIGVLPYVYIGSATLAVLIGLLYIKLQTRLPFPTLLVATLLFLLLSVCAFRFGFLASDAKWLSFAILFWLRLLLVLSNLEFWGLVGRLLNVRQGKRLFSLIGSGDLSAHILGGFATPPFVMMFGTMRQRRSSSSSAATSTDSLQSRSLTASTRGAWKRVKAMHGTDETGMRARHQIYSLPCQRWARPPAAGLRGETFDSPRARSHAVQSRRARREGGHGTTPEAAIAIWQYYEKLVRL